MKRPTTPADAPGGSAPDAEEGAGGPASSSPAAASPRNGTSAPDRPPPADGGTAGDAPRHDARDHDAAGPGTVHSTDHGTDRDTDHGTDRDTDHGTDHATDRDTDEGVGRRLSDRALLLITAVVTLPLVWLGYGTDLDIGHVLDAGARIRDLDYAPSRNPGVPVVEAIVGLLDPVGGHVLVNLATAAALAGTVVGIARLVRAWGHDNGDLIALAFLASPIAIISGTQTADFVWALLFLVWGALVLVGDRPVPAGVLLALAFGSRTSTLLLIGALLVADGWDRGHRRRSATAAAVLLPCAVLLFVPAWLAFDRTFGFLDTTDNWVGLGNNLGRALLKNYAVAGPALVVVLAIALPALVRSLLRWEDDPLVRFGVLGVIVTEALFLRMPWKPAHLLPALLAALLWIAASDRNRRGYLWVLIGAVAVNGLVTFRPFTADDPDNSSGGRFEPAVTIGWLVNDIRCRVEHMDEPPRIDTGAWTCMLEPMRGEVDDPADLGLGP
ncbi:MAG TPA: hypothetical protein VFI47_19130 [Acidimicrobiales bacterium]|nr:hypothetical protein [Acidimicrobiales bacterium]